MAKADVQGNSDPCPALGYVREVDRASRGSIAQGTRMGAIHGRRPASSSTCRAAHLLVRPGYTYPSRADATRMFRVLMCPPAGYLSTHQDRQLEVSRQGAMDLLHPLLEAGLVEKIGGKKTGRYALCSSRPWQ